MQNVSFILIGKLEEPHVQLTEISFKFYQSLPYFLLY